MTNKESTYTENKIKFYVFQDERFVDLNLYQFGWEDCDPMHQFGPAIRNHFLFHYVLKGKGRLEINNQTYYIHAGQGFLICPDQISTYYANPEDPWTYSWIEFDGLRARESLTLAGLSEEQPIYKPARENSIASILDNILENANHSPIRLIGYAMIMLDEIIDSSKNRIEFSNKRIRNFYIKEAIGHIDRNYQNNITIEELANACGLNRNYFGHIFKDTMGESPQQFLIHYRMTKAADLLKESLMTIADVGMSVGCENQLHFSRIFKSVYGLSPKNYRSKHFRGK